LDEAAIAARVKHKNNGTTARVKNRWRDHRGISENFPVSTQTMPRQAGSPRSTMAAAFSAQRCDSRPAVSTLSRCHGAVRAKPCCGAASACRLAPNHGKGDWDAAANCPAWRKRAVWAGEEDRPLAVRLPGGQLRSLQVKLARHTVERYRGLDQPVFRFDEIENAGNAKFGSELLGLHRSFLSREIIIADSRAAAPITKFGGSRSGRQIWVNSVGSRRSKVRPLKPNDQTFFNPDQLD
jgi:hypothetical protein